MVLSLEIGSVMEVSVPRDCTDVQVGAEVVERPEYAGCKTWVELDTAVPTDGAAPVLSDEAFAEVMGKIASLS